MTINSNKKLNILRDVLGESHCESAPKQQYLFFCPFPGCSHHKPKLSINIGLGKWKCWICNQKGGDLGFLIKRFGKSKNIAAWAEFDEKLVKEELKTSLFEEKKEPEELPKIELPKEYQIMLGKPRNSIFAKRYLDDRGITENDIKYWKIGFAAKGDYRNRIIIPSFNNDGDCNYFVARSFDNNKYPFLYSGGSRKNFIFNELFIDFQEPVIIVEGIFDAIKAGYNSIPLLGSSLSKEGHLFKKLVENNTKVYLALDRDAIKKQNEVADILRRANIEVYNINTSKYEDPGVMTKEQFRDCKNNAKLSTKNDILLTLLGVA